MTPTTWPPRYDDPPGLALDWTSRALCAQTDPELFFPDKGGSCLQAKKICRSCEAQAECLQYALDHHEEFGVWGGTSEQDRRPLLAHRAAAPAA